LVSINYNFHVWSTSLVSIYFARLHVLMCKPVYLVTSTLATAVFIYALSIYYICLHLLETVPLSNRWAYWRECKRDDFSFGGKGTFLRKWLILLDCY